MRLLGMFRFLVFSCLLSGLAFAQNVQVGVKGGARIVTDSIDPSTPGYRHEDMWYTVGPTLEFPLSRYGLNLEFDALYRRNGYTYQATTADGGFALQRYRGYAWDLPVLLKKYMGSADSKVRPFISAGYVGRVSKDGEVTSSVLSGTTLQPTFTDRYVGSAHWHNGVAVAGGVSAKLAGRFRGSAEIRYSAFPRQDRNYTLNGSNYRWNVNQLEVLAGFTF